MRLLDTSTLKVEEFFDNKTPPYAILSHTWGDEEITFQDLLGTPPSHKKGYLKLLGSCKQAKLDGLEYIWIDTCCIDKTSSAELSEAINSMYRWYRKSASCYIYLTDVENNTNPKDPGSSFRGSRWFTRGWTLQELIAPVKRIFFSASWTAIGCSTWTLARMWNCGVYKQNVENLPDLSTLVAEITGIDVEILEGGELSDVSVARRMSWAAKRQTTRTEDIAYCLMGVFDVNMPLLYGEGVKAFIRLQEEILKRSDDESLFAHTTPRVQASLDYVSFPTLLARSPACFSGWGNIGMGQSESRESVPALLTSKGLRVRLLLCYNTGCVNKLDTDVCLALLDCKFGEDSLVRVSIPLARLPDSRDRFWRLDPFSLHILNPGDDGPGSASAVVYSNGKPHEWSKMCLFISCISSIQNVLSFHAKLC